MCRAAGDRAGVFEPPPPLHPSAAAEGQQWALESPLNSGYAERYGVATLQSGQTPDFIISGRVRPGSQFITRISPPSGTNPGGAMEVVTQPWSVIIDFLVMP